MHNFNEYHYKLEWSWKEHCYVATVEEFPHLVRLSNSADVAFHSIMNDTIAEMNKLHQEGKEIPHPYTYNDHCAKTVAGKFGY